MAHQTAGGEDGDPLAALVLPVLRDPPQAIEGRGVGGQEDPLPPHAQLHESRGRGFAQRDAGGGGAEEDGSRQQLVAAEAALVFRGPVAVDDERGATKPAVHGRVGGRDREAEADHRLGAAPRQRAEHARAQVVVRTVRGIASQGESVDHLVLERELLSRRPRHAAAPGLRAEGDRQIDEAAEGLEDLEHVGRGDVRDQGHAAPVLPRGEGALAGVDAADGICDCSGHPQAATRSAACRCAFGARSRASRWVSASSIGATTQRTWWARFVHRRRRWKIGRPSGPSMRRAPYRNTSHAAVAYESSYRAAIESVWIPWATDWASIGNTLSA